MFPGTDRNSQLGQFNQKYEEWLNSTKLGSGRQLWHWGGAGPMAGLGLGLGSQRRWGCWCVSCVKPVFLPAPLPACSRLCPTALSLDLTMPLPLSSHCSSQTNTCLLFHLCLFFSSLLPFLPMLLCTQPDLQVSTAFHHCPRFVFNLKCSSGPLLPFITLKITLKS